MKRTAPPLKKKKMTNPLPLVHPPSSSSSTTFSSLPDEIVMNCLARISKSDYRSICLVSKYFNSLLSSPEIYKARSRIGATEPRLYVFLELPKSTPNHLWFTLSEMNDKLICVPLRLASSCPPIPYIFEITVAVGLDIYQIGSTTIDCRSKDVHVLDCRTHTWRRGPSMTEGRGLAKCWYLDGKIYVIGGWSCEEKPKNWGEVLDIKTQTWKPLPFPSGEDYCFRAAVFEGRLCVYFVKSENKYAYDPKEGRWLRDEAGFSDLELEPFSISPRWCFIDKLMFVVSSHKYKWYNSHCKKWKSVRGLADFYRDRPRNQGDDYMVRLANYGGKLVVMWHTKDKESQEISIWCTVISLEKRLTPSGLEIWGNVECSNTVLQVPEFYNHLGCVSVSV